MSTPRRALVTGAGGFVGANLVRRLLADGHEVTAVRRPTGEGWRLSGVKNAVEVLEIDLVDPDAAASLVGTAAPDWVFHLAAHGAYSWQTDPSRIMQTNALATVSLVEACVQTGCDAFVHAGSSSEYGLKDHAPSEDEPLEPNSAYAVAKAAATGYCGFASRTGRLNAVTLRLYSAYGPYEEPRRLIPRLVVCGLDGRLPPLVDPDTARDFVYVDDVVEAMILAAEHPHHRPGAIYNIGSGRQTSIGEIVALVCDLLPVRDEPDWGSANGRSWDTATWRADPQRAADELGWKPSVDLEAGLGRMVSWLGSSEAVRRAYGIEA